jgi:PAS domain S-box-containing protein
MTIFAGAPLAHLEVGKDGTIRAANDACASIFHLRARDLVGRRLVDLFADDRAKIQVRALLERGRAAAEEIVVGRGSAQLYAWLAGDALHIMILDITEHRRLQIELEESEARFRALGDGAPVLLWMSGRDARCTFFNQRWLEFTGRKMEDELGDGWVEGVHPEDFQECMDTYLGAFVARRTFRMEYRLRRADGAYRWLLDTGLPRHMPDGTFAGYVGSCVDITEQRDRKDELEHAVQVRDELFAIASHELRTPISALVLHLTTGRIDRAVKTTGRLTTLVDHLLDVSRIATGHLRLERQECELAAIAQGVIERVGEGAQAIGLTAPEPVRGVWDRVRLEQVLENLLSNAVKYGAGRPIDIDVAGHSEAATIVVQDRGIGISPTDLGRIFGRFERAVPSRAYSGLGLGLYIARQIVDAHGGTIRVSSELGHGSRFTVELPRRAN